MDHWFQMENLGGPQQPMMEGYTMLGYLAAVTERVRLSLLVTGVTYRHPGLLAKTVATLDVLSGGRAMLGIGAAWYEREHAGLGVPFPPLKERFDRLEETLQISPQLWSSADGDQGRYSGTHYQLAETVRAGAAAVAPADPDRGERRAEDAAAGGDVRRRLQPVRGEPRGRRAQARRAAASLRRRRARLRLDPQDDDRDGRPVSDRDRFLSAMERYAAVGISLVTLVPQGDDPVAWTSRLCEDVLPRLKVV